MVDEILIFGGSGSPKLTIKICEYLNVQPGAGEVLRFSEGNLFVRVRENVRGRRVYLVNWNPGCGFCILLTSPWAVCPSRSQIIGGAPVLVPLCHATTSPTLITSDE